MKICGFSLFYHCKLKIFTVWTIGRTNTFHYFWIFPRLHIDSLNIIIIYSQTKGLRQCDSIFFVIVLPRFHFPHSIFKCTFSQSGVVPGLDCSMFPLMQDWPGVRTLTSPSHMAQIQYQQTENRNITSAASSVAHRVLKSLVRFQLCINTSPGGVFWLLSPCCCKFRPQVPVLLLG